MHKGGKDDLQEQTVICLRIFTYKMFFFLRFLDEFKTSKDLCPVGRALGGRQNMRRRVCYQATFELNSEKHELPKQVNGMIRFVFQKLQFDRRVEHILAGKQAGIRGSNQ